MMIHQLLKQYWGYDQFRPLQEDIIRAVLQGHDTLALLPTGGGKSICFQVPALALGGLCVVVSPLIALMKDQVEQLQQRGIAAAALYSGMSAKAIDLTLEQAAQGQLQFLYLSPERLRTELFLARAPRMPIKLLAIDEAHCISQWGYDFRPPYLQIADFRATLPADTRLIAVTATATEQVKLDIQEKLRFKPDSRVFQKSFARANLSYSAFEEENKETRMLKILNNVRGTAVVYVRNRKRTQQIAEWLSRQGISADFYHAGLNHTQRAHKQDRWIRNQTRVMVATNAFGMGIDKPDVRVVVHLDLPDSLEAYYQEAGRGGRDEQKAYAVALYEQKDLQELDRQLAQSYPPAEQLRAVYQALANHYQLAVGAESTQSFSFDVADFAKQAQLNASMVYYSLKVLQDEGFIQLNDAFFSPSQVMLLLPHQDTYEYQLKQPTFEPLLSGLLRTYGGVLYQQFCRISEAQLATQLRTKTAIVVQQLQYLHQQGILSYEQQKDSPQLQFLTIRYAADRLPLNHQRLAERKAVAQEKIAAVQHYMQHRQRCRTQLLLEYFGEVSYQPCEICDICLAKRKAASASEDYGLYSPQIKALLSAEPLSAQVLAQRIDAARQERVMAVVRQMLDEGLLQLSPSQQLMLAT
ncbi:RecQ family ATP-dependent DNA helicase [Eisenibacter elegans]|jgi:ATP-dependent DNA helicase RecQ|uniref:RecQ family ATP-dependent DNA helicase n=1 Tax=Eisenibacter elegans TaxID=997 RepID=UPI0012B603F6|nr:ATP-dependent DNA helicase RecQ [Eisenibacter elegans]